MKPPIISAPLRLYEFTGSRDHGHVIYGKWLPRVEITFKHIACPAGEEAIADLVRTITAEGYQVVDCAVVEEHVGVGQHVLVAI